jgi:hypothetical protein
MMLRQKRELNDLLEVHEPAWPLVKSWISEASNPIEVLPPDLAMRNQMLLDVQVGTRSSMGAILYESGGLLIDHGWLRFLGSGHARLPRSLPEWNRARVTISQDGAPSFFLIADDIVGGFFALNGGAFGASAGQVFYFAPDALRWEPMSGMGYSQFLVWSLGPSLDKFYRSLRWKGWASEAAALRGDQAFSFYPFLWTKEGKQIERCSRKACPVDEIFALNVLDFFEQLRKGGELAHGPE